MGNQQSKRTNLLQSAHKIQMQLGQLQKISRQVAPASFSALKRHQVESVSRSPFKKAKDSAPSTFGQAIEYASSKFSDKSSRKKCDTQQKVSFQKLCKPRDKCQTEARVKGSGIALKLEPVRLLDSFGMQGNPPQYQQAKNKLADSIRQLIAQSKGRQKQNSGINVRYNSEVGAKVTNLLIASVRKVHEPELNNLCDQLHQALQKQFSFDRSSLQSSVRSNRSLEDSRQMFRGIAQLQSQEEMQLLEIVSLQWDNEDAHRPGSQAPPPNIRVEESWSSQSDRVMVML